MGDGTMNTEVPIDASGKVYHLACTGQDVADNILLVGDPGRVKDVAALFDSGSLRFEAHNREIVTMTGTYKGVPVTAMSTGMGTDNVEIVMTELHIIKEYQHSTGTWGPRRMLNIIRCGTCGCPHADVDPGTLAVTECALGLDNTGRFYADVPPPDAAQRELTAAVQATPLRDIPPYVARAHPQVTGTLSRLAASRSRRHIVGHTASASGFYACQGRRVGHLSNIRFPQLPELLAGLRANGKPVANIEMETSALCQIGGILGYRAGAVCVVLANRAGGKGSLLPDKDKKPAMTDCLTLALDTLRELNSAPAHL
eukprot:TRINITY_DN59949_c0_g1_i1.p1 TRINITY_DN59949_c0_g1~~TRINITY_DN59949_c0_g1_i1.p1  ORF type:complete len:341 (+),score=118.09 TRINITY_DN59949_c0_g1_i1:86-1024(+)